jgi:hypothetical protein
MQKSVISNAPSTQPNNSAEGWIDLEDIARVEVTSEDPSFPVEGAFNLTGGPGWRASEPGEQQIRLLFAEPIAVRRIQIRFEEATRERTQQFTLRWSGTGGQSNEIVRQQWNFSPSGSTTEIEDLRVNLEGVTALELTIKPDIGDRSAIATLASMRLL